MLSFVLPAGAAAVGALPRGTVINAVDEHAASTRSRASALRWSMVSSYFCGNRNNIALFGKDDLLLYADGAQKLDNSVKDLCEAGLIR